MLFRSVQIKKVNVFECSAEEEIKKEKVQVSASGRQMKSPVISLPPPVDINTSIKTSNTVTPFNPVSIASALTTEYPSSSTTQNIIYVTPVDKPSAVASVISVPVMSVPTVTIPTVSAGAPSLTVKSIDVKPVDKQSAVASVISVPVMSVPTVTIPTVHHKRCTAFG